MTTAVARPAGRRRDWAVVAGREVGDLWLSGRGPAMMVAFSVLLSVVAWLVATNQALNYLEQRESVGLVLQVAVAVGALMVLLAAANAISGERERGTLESLLVTPVSRPGLVAGKLLAALSLWAAAAIVALPYVWFLGRDVGVVAVAVGVGALVGTLVAVCLASLGGIVSVLSASNRWSLMIGLFVLLALYAPTQLPTGAKRGWAGELLQRVNPLAAGGHVLDRVVVAGQPLSDEWPWLASPLICAAVGVTVLTLRASRMGLRGGRTP